MASPQSTHAPQSAIRDACPGRLDVAQFQDMPVDDRQIEIGKLRLRQTHRSSLHDGSAWISERMFVHRNLRHRCAAIKDRPGGPPLRGKRRFPL
jgi:hypothetical protein